MKRLRLLKRLRFAIHEGMYRGGGGCGCVKRRPFCEDQALRALTARNPFELGLRAHSVRSGGLKPLVAILMGRIAYSSRASAELAHRCDKHIAHTVIEVVVDQDVLVADFAADCVESRRQRRQLGCGQLTTS